MRDFLNLGSTPPAEDCVQLGEDNYRANSIKESRRYIDLLREKMGVEPDGAELKIKWFSHDFGRYCEVVCWFDEEKPEAVDYAYKCESDGPQTW